MTTIDIPYLIHKTQPAQNTNACAATSAELRLLTGAPCIMLLLCAGLLAYQLATLPLALGLTRAGLIGLANGLALLGIITLLRPAGRAVNASLWLGLSAVLLLTMLTLGGVLKPVVAVDGFTLLAGGAAAVGLVTLLLKRRLRCAVAPWHTPWRWVTVSTFILLAPTNYAMALYQPGHLLAGGRIGGDEHHILLDPTQWRNWPLHIAGHIDIGRELQHGTWTILFCDSDDATQMPLVAALYELARPDPEHGPDHRYQLPAKLACIQVSSPADRGKEAQSPPLFREDIYRRLGSLQSYARWIVDTPVLLSVHNNTVTQVLTGAELTGAIDVLAQHLTPAQSPQVHAEARDLGYVEPGSELELSFLIHNPTDRTITVTDIVSQCSCMGLADDLRTLPPGAAKEVIVYFDVPAQPAHYSRKIVLHTDHADHPRIDLVIDARIGLPLRLEPRPLRIAPRADTMHHAHAATGGAAGVLTLINDGPHPARILYGHADDPRVAVQLARTTLDPGAAIEIPIVIDTAIEGGAVTAINEATITIRTNVPAQRELHTPLQYVLPPHN